MPTLVPSSIDQHVIVAKQTLSHYLKGRADLTIRHRPVFRMLEEAGRIVKGRKGHSTTWSVQIREADVRPIVDGAVPEFAPIDRTEQYSLPHRSLVATDRLTYMKNDQMGGPETIVDYLKEMPDNLLADMRKKLNRSVYIDGSLAANAGHYHGLETFLGEGTVTVADIIAAPDATYAGQSTQVLHFGGTWSNSLSTKPNASLGIDWPRGTGSAEVGAGSPLLVNDASTGWGVGSGGWRNTCEEVIRFTVGHMVKLGALDSTRRPFPLVFMHELQRLSELKTYISVRSLPLVPYKEMQEFGFGATAITFEGAIHDLDADVPVNTTYGISVPMMEFYSLFNDLFESDVFQDKSEFSIKAYIRTHGNFRFQPKAFAKIYPYAAS